MDHPFIVLSVEDNPDDQLILELAFRRAGLPNALRSVQDGDQATAYLLGSAPFADRSRFPIPDVILLDLKLPKKSGLSVLEWIKTWPEFRNVPVIILTSSKEPSDLRRAYELGVTSYMVKPTGFDEMLALVKAVTTYWFGLNLWPPK
jgi:CheY-like chemotaxis protein